MEHSEPVTPAPTVRPRPVSAESQNLPLSGQLSRRDFARERYGVVVQWRPSSAYQAPHFGLLSRQSRRVSSRFQPLYQLVLVPLSATSGDSPSCAAWRSSTPRDRRYFCVVRIELCPRILRRNSRFPPLRRYSGVRVEGEAMIGGVIVGQLRVASDRIQPKRDQLSY
jgi:hypothetical protein